MSPHELPPLPGESNSGAHRDYRPQLCRLPLRPVPKKVQRAEGSPFNYLEFPTDIVFQVVLCRLRYKLSLRDLAEMFSLGACREADFVAPASTTFTDADFPLWSRLVPLTG